MSRLAIAMDIGTSGLRAQAVDISLKKIISTAITTRHPLPGTNVIDHIHLALEMGVKAANRILIQAVNRIVRELAVDMNKVVCFAVCGNPIQLSQFQGVEIRDFAYAGQRKLKFLGVVSPKREAVITAARNILGLSYWTEGMPISLYKKFLKKYGFPDLPTAVAVPEIIRTVKRDIGDLGQMGLTIIPDIGRKIKVDIKGCTACINCVEECRENAATLITETDPVSIVLDQALCSGVACRGCEHYCPEKCFDLSRITVLEDIRSARLIEMLESKAVQSLRRIPHISSFSPDHSGQSADRPEMLVRVLELALHKRKKLLQSGLIRAAREMSPHVDDCVGLVIGGRDNYYAEQCKIPGTYFMTPGWTCHWKKIFGPDSSGMEPDMAKRLFHRYERSLLVVTEVMSKDNMKENVEEFNRLFSCRSELRKGTMAILNKTWKAAKAFLKNKDRPTLAGRVKENSS